MDEKQEKVIETARGIFLKYGYRRVTMGDIAEATKMSRPALYLVFPSKEEILTAVVAETFAEMLDEIRKNIQDFATAEEQLASAFEIWSVRPFEMIEKSPDARDLLESSYEFADKVTTKAFADFEKMLSGILEPTIKSNSGANLSSAQTARLMASAVYGFKNAAANSLELRELIEQLIEIVLLSLQARSSKAGS